MTAATFREAGADMMAGVPWCGIGEASRWPPARTSQ